jgi:DNA-binding CsgD family transcriptional regulator
MALMYNMDSDNLVHIAQEVDKICHPFLHSRGIPYFQFKSIYKDGSLIILANRPDFFKDILEKEFMEPSPHRPYTHQSSIYFWDESLSESHLSLIRERQGVYHGLTIISRRKDFYDCTTFAMAERLPAPTAYYFQILKELQKFVELFPTLARSLIEKACEKPVKAPPISQGVSRKSFFLPKRSVRFRIGEGTKDYITTYEALCVQLVQEGKSYKEIGSLLSMAPTTVKTHLKRFKERTGLTLQELSLQAFQNPEHSIFNLDKAKKSSDLSKKKLKKEK